MIIAIPIGIYLGLLVAHLLAPLHTGFILPKSLWILVPFRCVGWRGSIERHKIYRINWMWSSIDFSSFYIEEKK